MVIGYIRKNEKTAMIPIIAKDFISIVSLTLKYTMRATKNMANKLSKWTPIARPNMYAIRTNQRSLYGLSWYSDHFNASQTTIAVNNIDIAYTSASTALNQKVSVTAKVKLPTNPPP